MGTVVDDATAFIPGTGFRASGPLLITHWGMSGPAILKLSSHAARELHDHHYQMPYPSTGHRVRTLRYCSNCRTSSAAIRRNSSTLSDPSTCQAACGTICWRRPLAKEPRTVGRTSTKKELNRLVNTLCNDSYQIAGRAAFKDEFVTCGGISLAAVNPTTLESKDLPHVYFAGEVLDIDGITGGFNFQAAWTTAYTAAQAISQQHH